MHEDLVPIPTPINLPKEQIKTARTLLRHKNKNKKKKMDRKRRHAEINSDAAEIIAGNIDLIMEIIVRLPAKLLLRFQLVSKDWRSAISCPAFCRRHTLRQRLRVPPFLILRDSSQRRFFFLNPHTRLFLPYRFNFPYSFTKILQCCNGLMLLECKSSPYGQKVYIVHNPTTWESREVPIEHKRRKMSFRLAGLCLAYDPAISPNYRVVCVKNKRPNFWISIYDSESRNWTEIEQPFFSSNFQLKFWNGIYSNNVIYWLRPTSDSFYFDLETGKLGRPPRVRGRLRKERYTTRCNVLESNGHLYCIFLYMHIKEHQRKYFVVFELREDNAGWVKYRVDVTGPSHALWEIEGAITPLAIARGEVEGEFTILFHVDGKLISYRFAAGAYDIIVELRREEEKVAAQTEGRSRLQFQPSDTFQFVDSLVPV